MQNALLQPVACDEGASTVATGKASIVATGESGVKGLCDEGASPVPMVIVPKSLAESLVEMTLATCASPETRRVYRIALVKFIASGYPLNREGVAAYLQAERDRGSGTSYQAIAISAVRKLATEAQIRGLMTFEELSNIKSIKSGRQYKTRAGQWLTVDQAFAFLDLPDRQTYWGKRDAAILSLMLGCALRRAEMTALKWTHYQTREDRMCLVDFTGKGNKLRTVPVPLWATDDVDAWKLAQLEPPPNPEAFSEKHRTRNPEFITGGMSGDALWQLVVAYGLKGGHQLAPHDLRRTLAQMLRRNGAPLEQIQATLGHENIQTTTIYLGSKLELAPGTASVDQLRRKTK